MHVSRRWRCLARGPQGSVAGRLRWLYADPAHKLLQLRRAAEAVAAVHDTVLDTMATRTAGSSGADDVLIDGSPAEALAAFLATPAAARRFAIGAQRWLWDVRWTHEALMAGGQRHVAVGATLAGPSARVFPTHSIEKFLLDPALTADVLICGRANPGCGQRPAPWLFVRHEVDRVKASRTIAGSATAADQQAAEGATSRQKGHRLTLPPTSALRRTLSGKESVDFINDLPYRRSSLDDTGRTVLGRLRGGRPATTYRQSAAQRAAAGTWTEGSPLAQDGSVTVATAGVWAGAGPPEVVLATAVAAVLSALYLDGRALKLSTDVPAVAAAVETIFEGLCDQEECLVVDVVPPPADIRCDFHAWAVLDAAEAYAPPHVAALAARILRSRSRTVIAPAAWPSLPALEALLAPAGIAVVAAPDTRGVAQLAATAGTAYVTMVSASAGGQALAQSLARQLEGPAAVVGINVEATDALLCVPGARSPLPWQPAQMTDAAGSWAVGNTARIADVTRSVLHRSGAVTGRGRCLSSLAACDDVGAPLIASGDSRSAAAVGERVIAAGAAGFRSPLALAGIASARLLGL